MTSVSNDTTQQRVSPVVLGARGAQCQEGPTPALTDSASWAFGSFPLRKDHFHRVVRVG